MISPAVVLFTLGVLVSSIFAKEFYVKEYYAIENAETYFEDFIRTHNKMYKSDEEKQARFEVFKTNLEKVNDMNKKENLTVFGINQFSDLSIEEFLERYGTYRLSSSEMQCQMHVVKSNGSRVAAPDSFDWRLYNKVGRVKEQSSCGSCWAFSLAANIEGQYAIKHNQLMEFSEQQLLDCTGGSCSCTSGFTTTAALTLAQYYGGIMMEQQYPYENVQRQCRFDPSKVVAKVTGCRQFIFSSEEEIKETLVNVGPLSIGVAMDDNFNKYKEGILRDCGYQINHAVLLVGYGSENGEPYWLIKNSHGITFGDYGYIKIKRGINLCNIMGSEIITTVVQ